MDKDTLIAVDLAKSVFEIAVSQEPGKVSERARLPRAKFLEFFVNRPPATVIMEACGSAHYWGREIEQLGHRVVLLPPHQVRPYVLRNKTDRTDVKGLLEAYRNEDIHQVPVKSVEQQVLVALHRLRAAAMAERTATINTVRGLLREFGVTIPAGAKHVLPAVATLVTDPASALPVALHAAFTAATEAVHTLEGRIAAIDRQLTTVAEHSPA
ncbi:MAG: IS110 family transposase, partial [Terriglobales bacterium]